MNVWKKALVLGGCMAALTLGFANHAVAQGRDPAQMRQGRLDDLRQKLEIKDDAEWSAIEPKVTKVMDAGRDVMGMRLSGMFGGRGGGRRREGGDTNAGDNNRQRRGGFFGEPPASLDALQKAIDAKAPAAELKTKMAAVRAETKEREAKLDAAEEDLRSVLTPRQEAVAMVNGLLR
jgi:hypothetical protein